MLQLDKPEDFVIATGVSISLENFVERAFEILGLDWKDHVLQDRQFFRPTDILISSANPEKAIQKLGWSAKIRAENIVNEMMKEIKVE